MWLITFLVLFEGKVLLGRHRCLWCEIPSGDLIRPRGERGSYPARTLDRLTADLNKFLGQGHGNLSNAKLFNNVIAPRLLDNIDISQVKCII